MALLSDKTIAALCTGACSHVISDIIEESSRGSISREKPETRIDNNGKTMIQPFFGTLIRQNQKGEKVISYGLSSYGYDVRLSDTQVKVFTSANGAVIDPMRLDDEACLVDAAIHGKDEDHPYFILPPNSYALGYTIEYFHIPRNVSVICLGKSTYARAGAIVNVTPIEAGFEGNVVIEISNGSTLPIKIYLGAGIAQFQFLRGDQECKVSYADGNRKYQGQTGITLPRV